MLLKRRKSLRIRLCIGLVGLMTAVAPMNVFASSWFQESTLFGTGAQPKAVAAGDFNGDGNPDIAVANAADGTVSILLGQGDGTFGAKVDYPVESKPNAIAVGQFNSTDTYPDLAVANYGSSSVSILLGKGDGTFQPATHFSTGTGTGPYAIAVGSFNRNTDDHSDIAITSILNNNVILLFGDGAGNFQLGPSYGLGTGTSPQSIAVGDFDGNGALDLVTANYASATLSLLPGNLDGANQADGTFGTAASIALTYNPLSVAVGEFDGTAGIDIAAGTLQSMTILHGDGTGGFSFNPAQDNHPSSTLYALAAADFNQDGKTDVAGAGNFTHTIAVWQQGGATLLPQAGYATDFKPVSVVSADFDHDGFPDLAAANEGSNNVSILINDGHGKFLSPYAYSFIGTPASVATGDFNGDGITDLAVLSDSNSFVDILLGQGDGTFQMKQILTAGSGPRFIAAGDIDADNDLDLVAVNENDGTVSVFSWDQSAGQFGNAMDSAVFNVNGALPVSVAIGDFNSDGSPDLAVACSGYNIVTILLGDGSGVFAFNAGSSYATGTHPQSIVAGDFNGDSVLDLAVANKDTDDVSILPGNGANGQGDGTFGTATSYSTGASPSYIAADDFNKDNILDLAVANSGDDNVSILRGNGANGAGDGTFSKTGDYPVGSNPQFISIGLFNGDMVWDLAVANKASNTVSVLIGNKDANGSPDGAFAAADTLFIGKFAAPVAVVSGDFGGGPMSELAVADSNWKRVSVYSPFPYGGQLDLQPAAINVNENAGSVAVTVVRTDGSGKVSVAYTTSNGSAAAGIDYTAVSGKLVFPDGDTAESFTIPILDDHVYTGSRTVNIQIGNPGGGAVLGTQTTAVLTIADDENPPTAPPSSPSSSGPFSSGPSPSVGQFALKSSVFNAGENGGNASITVIRSGGSYGTASVKYATSDGTAAAGSDYTAVSGTLVFQDGETSKSFSVPIIDDKAYKGNRTVKIQISEPSSGAALGTPTTAELMIADDEKPADSTPADSPGFSDIAGHWAAASIVEAVKQGIASGYPDGTFKPNRSISRAEFAVMLVHALKPQTGGANLTFSDKSAIGDWASEAIAQAVRAGILSGYDDGSFRPNAFITRAEMASMIARALRLPVEPEAASAFADNAEIPGWARGAVEAVRVPSIFIGRSGNRFVPNASATRAEAVTVILKLLEHQR
ncbi:FG-GAP-like repeat-containing protein [Cohnella caldifontis]|uniref:FG-GAP-like repeat-containing protein n=1 Tax=Cohnella caldifontis TaxID=3027471 RepID=UPI0023EB30DA|nr:FG-GAP-like repeat-containing protein [Cohnella sp. YIM B05605]